MKRLTVVAVAAAGLVLFVLGSSATAQGGDNAADVEAGGAVYASSCAGCHGAEGMGVAGLGRPLTGIAAQGDRDQHIMSITDGRGGMPAFGPNLSEEEISQATSFVRLTFVEDAAAADDDAAAADDAELAETGVESTGLAVLGATMLFGGLQLVVWSRRER